MSIIDSEKDFETIWHALEAWEDDRSNGDWETQIDDVKGAMASLREAVNAPDEVYDSLSMLRDIISASELGEHSALMDNIMWAKNHINGIDRMKS